MFLRQFRRTAGVVLTWIIVLAGSTAVVGNDVLEVPLYEGLGKHQRKVTTDSSLAQRYFNQGLNWVYAFNHEEAIRSFKKAAELDSNCAMAWWGIALSNGPHINYPSLPPERAAEAWEALRKARAVQAQASSVEQAFIDALAKRYADPAPHDRAALEKAYAEAMGKVWADYPRDSDVGTLYAESLMNLRPWDLWSVDQKPRPETPTIIAVLEEVLRLDPDHPGAHHLYIHAIEPSPHPEKAIASAEGLCKLVPGSGHLVHMPSHIFVLTGRWADAVKQNELAIEADRAYRRIAPEPGFYRLYMLHNQHMLSFAAMMEGRSTVAIEAARAAINSVPADYLKREAVLVDPYMGAAYDALKRFGRWDDILKEPPPPSCLPITTTMWRMNRAVAHAAKGEIALAEQERAAFSQAATQVPEDALMAINTAKDILEIARHFLDGEIAYRQGDLDESVRRLRLAITTEDRLRYMEPPEWMQPVRHTLGAVLMDARRYQEAEQVYRADLKKWPENGWSLYGLSRCLHALGSAAEAKKVQERFREAWSRADTPIDSSCLCVPGI